jgi:hypothetical protein
MEKGKIKIGISHRSYTQKKKEKPEPPARGNARKMERAKKYEEKKGHGRRR